MTIEDKHVVLTGGSSGIGRKMAQMLGAKNRLELLGRDVETLESFADQFPRARVWKCDLSQRADVERVGRAMGEDGKQPIDLLILNAAVQSPQTLTSSSFDMDTAERELAVNFLSACSLLHLLLPKLRAGSVVTLVNSGLAIAPKASSPIYCASKAALRNLGQSLSWELSPRGIKVKQAYLPLVDTPMTEGRGSKKMKAAVAARSILEGIEGRGEEIFVGKTRTLWWLSRLAPNVARGILAGQ